MIHSLHIKNSDLNLNNTNQISKVTDVAVHLPFFCLFLSFPPLSNKKKRVIHDFYFDKGLLLVGAPN